MAKEKVRKRKDGQKLGRSPRDTDLKPPDYQPSKAELEEDISVPVTLEEFAKAALSGGEKRRVSK